MYRSVAIYLMSRHFVLAVFLLALADVPGCQFGLQHALAVSGVVEGRTPSHPSPGQR